VQDAVIACGGFRADADPALLNLAALLSDGSQVVVGTLGAPAGEVNAGSGGGSGGGEGQLRVNLNTANSAELEALPGVGPVTAGKILAWRSEHGRFSNITELQEVSGIGVKTFAQLEPYIYV
jgi:competence protein ComEA